MQRKKILNDLYNRREENFRYMSKALLRTTQRSSLFSMQLFPLFLTLSQKKAKTGSRIKNFCFVTGRSRSVFGFWGLSRLGLKKYFNKGYLPGVMKASW
jgi:small subunit ribosomal protein S14